MSASSWLLNGSRLGLAFSVDFFKRVDIWAFRSDLIRNRGGRGQN